MEWLAHRAPLSVRLGASIAAILASLAFATGASAALNEAERLRDLNPGPLGSSPHGGVPFGHQIVFRASNPSVGDEPWVTDGTAAGTMPLEVVPGATGSVPGDFTSLGDVVVFLAIGPGGDELWRTDGTPSGTTRVRDINPGPASSNPRSFIDLGDQAVFRANDGATGVEPWRTDGTAAGTSRVADVNPGPGNGVGGFFFPERLGNHVLFNGIEPVAGSELWRLPVAGSGADLVANIALVGGSQPLQLTPVGDTVFFTADDGIVGRELWRSDGQPGGDYQLVEDFDNAATDSGIGGIRALGDHVFFPVEGDGNGTELWRADESGAEIVRDINPAGDSNPQNLTAAGNWLYFTANDGTNGRELWRSDGEPAGTTEMVADINPAGSSPCGSPGITPLGDEVFFCASDGSTGNELWRSNGTEAGTSRVADLNPGAPSSAPTSLAVHGDTLYFAANDGVTGTEPWTVDTGRPDTAIVSGPAAGSRIADRTPSFQLGSTAVDLARFECSPSGAEGSFRPCAGRDGSAVVARLADGDHLLTFRAVDVRDNADRNPAQVALSVDGTAPRVVLKGKRLKLKGKRTIRAKLLCKSSEVSGPCRGRLALKTAKRLKVGGKRKKVTLGKKKFRLKPGKAKRVRVKLRRKPARLVRSNAAARRVKVGGTARDALGNSRKFKKRLRLRVP